MPDYSVMAELMRTLGSRAESAMDLLPFAERKKQLGKLASTLWSATAAEHGLFLARAFLLHADAPLELFPAPSTSGTLFLF